MIFPPATLSLVTASLLGVALASAQHAPAETTAPPNVVLIVVDDAGYGDFGFQGSRTVRTPHIDALAAGGVACTAGYVTASVCSPSRAGLLTGRYQERFGHEFNLLNEYTPDAGLDPKQQTLAERLRPLGYHTVAIGKWHLGYLSQFHPQRHGFDDFYGFLEGWRSYWPGERSPVRHLLRNEQPADESFEYLTDELGNAAARVIAEAGERPFFLYLAFTAPHAPCQAKQSELARFADVDDESRRVLAAMTASLDDAVGNVLEALEERKIADNTLVIFLNDNGGATNNGSDNAPFRGHKGTLYEGGVRVPFIFRWPSVLPAGETYDAPVSALDVVPTVMAAATQQAEPMDECDGVDLVPYFTGAQPGCPHPTLYWRRGSGWAIRDGEWKLLTHQGERPELYNLADDPAESRDLAASQPDRAAKIQQLYDAWDAQMAHPAWEVPWQ